MKTLARIQRWNQRRQTRKILNSLPDRILDDIGAFNSDIYGIAVEGGMMERRSLSLAAIAPVAMIRTQSLGYAT